MNKEKIDLKKFIEKWLENNGYTKRYHLDFNMDAVDENPIKKETKNA